VGKDERHDAMVSKVSKS